jgi:hypothetical protein
MGEHTSMDVKKLCVPARGLGVQIRSLIIVFRQDLRPFTQVYR